MGGGRVFDPSHSAGVASPARHVAPGQR